MTSAAVQVVSRALGVERARARTLVAAMRRRRAPVDYWARFALFAIAVSPLGSVLGGHRRRAVAPFVFKLLDRPTETMYFLGSVDELPREGCRGLLPE